MLEQRWTADKSPNWETVSGGQSNPLTGPVVGLTRPSETADRKSQMASLSWWLEAGSWRLV